MNASNAKLLMKINNRDGEMIGSLEELTITATGSLRMRNELRGMTRRSEQ